MRVAIVGSREYARLDLVRAYVRKLPKGTVVVSGGAGGVDKTAEDAARERGLEVVSYPADWKRYGRGAGPIRNKTIVEDADRLVAFWDGESKGTLSSIRLAAKAKKALEVYGNAGQLEAGKPWQ